MSFDNCHGVQMMFDLSRVVKRKDVCDDMVALSHVAGKRSSSDLPCFSVSTDCRCRYAVQICIKTGETSIGFIDTTRSCVSNLPDSFLHGRVDWGVITIGISRTCKCSG